MIKFFTFEQFHNRKGIGSTKIRVHNLIKYWDEAGLYIYGQNPDVLIFQKVYIGQDYKFPAHFEGIKILDICDPDWFDGALIKETVDAMDAVVCPTQPLANFIQQLTDKPVRVIKDRFDLSEFPKPKLDHIGTPDRVVWFGYKQNAETLRFVIPSLERLGLGITIISNEDPHVERWAMNDYKDKVTFVPYNQETIYHELQKHDICILPQGDRPQDMFKSDNKRRIAQLCGLAVVHDKETLDTMLDPVKRTKWAKANYNVAKNEYDCRKSVDDYKELINELKLNKE